MPPKSQKKGSQKGAKPQQQQKKNGPDDNKNAGKKTAQSETSSKWGNFPQSGKWEKFLRDSDDSDYDDGGYYWEGSSDSSDDAEEIIRSEDILRRLFSAAFDSDFADQKPDKITSTDPISNTRLFRPFVKLPATNSRYVDGVDWTKHWKPWFFAGEIARVERFIRLGLYLTSSSGEKECKLMFYPDEDSINFSGMIRHQAQSDYVKEGYTVILLCPETKHFMDFTFGIRFETAEWFLLQVSFAEFAHNVCVLLHNWERQISKVDPICTQCSKSITNALNYNWCPKNCCALYCSISCKNKAASTHAKLCSYYPLLLCLGSIGRLPKQSFGHSEGIPLFVDIIRKYRYTKPTEELGAYVYNPKDDEKTKRIIANPVKFEEPSGF